MQIYSKWPPLFRHLAVAPKCHMPQVCKLESLMLASKQSQQRLPIGGRESGSLMVNGWLASKRENPNRRKE